MKSPRSPKSAWRSYGSSSGSEPKAAVADGGIGVAAGVAVGVVVGVGVGADVAVAVGVGVVVGCTSVGVGGGN